MGFPSDKPFVNPQGRVRMTWCAVPFANYRSLEMRPNPQSVESMVLRCACAGLFSVLAIGCGEPAKPEAPKPSVTPTEAKVQEAEVKEPAPHSKEEKKAEPSKTPAKKAAAQDPVPSKGSGSAAPVDPRALFDSMEKALVESKTLQFDYSVAITAADLGINSQLSGRVVLGEEEKGWLSYEGKLAGKQTRTDLHSDGKSMTVTVRMGQAGPPEQQVSYTPSHFKRNTSGLISRWGVYTTITALIPPKNPPPKRALPPLDMNKMLPIQECKTGAREKVDGRDAQEVVLLSQAGGRNTTVRVWIDLETCLPLKRISVIEQGGQSSTFTTSFRDFKLNQDIDPKTFVAPVVATAGGGSIKENEDAAISVCMDFVKAQNEYRKRDWDNDRILEFATTLSGKLGLYGPGCGRPIKGIAAAARESGNPRPTPYKGYHFAVLTGEGPSFHRQTKSYMMKGGHMVLGFALLAYPAEYGKTGKRIFIVNQTLNIWGKDLGPETVRQCKYIKVYAQDRTWKLVASPHRQGRPGGR